MNALTTTNTNKPTSIFDGGFAASAKVLIGQGGTGIWLTSMAGGKKSLYVRPETDKAKMLRWDGRIGLTRYAAFFDFDSVPSEFIDRFHVSQSMDMEAFYQYLRFTYPGECVFRSAGGNVKMMFVFDGCTKQEAIEELSETFPELWQHVDQNAMWHTIVPFEAVNVINDFIKRGNVRRGFDIERPEWQFKHNDAIDSLVASTNGRAQKRLLHFVLSVKTAGPYIYLPISKLAEVAGCSTSTAKRFVDNALANGDIVCTCSDYCPGSFSRRYKILNADWIDAMGIDENRGSEVLGVDMGAFVEGNWFKALWQHTRFFVSGAEFMLFVNSINGANAPNKGRISKARSAWRSHARRNGLSTEVV